MIRPATLADISAIARVHVHSWRTTYRGLMPDDVLARLSYERREQQWSASLQRGDEQIVVAEVDAQVVGFASGGRERSGDAVYTGELYAIYLLEAYQRRGLGTQLTAAIVERLIADGHAAMLVWVLHTNPSRRFYEALGGQFLREQSFTLAGMELIEAGYGWRDLPLLHRRLLRS